MGTDLTGGPPGPVRRLAWRDGGRTGPGGEPSPRAGRVGPIRSGGIAAGGRGRGQDGRGTGAGMPPTGGTGGGSPDGRVARGWGWTESGEQVWTGRAAVWPTGSPVFVGDAAPPPD